MVTRVVGIGRWIGTLGRWSTASRRLDGLLRASAVLGAAGIAVSVALPHLGEWVAFFTLVALVSGPTTVVVPVSSEPFIMAFGKLQPPMLVAAVGTAALVAVEFVNYPVFDAAVHARVLARARESRVTRRLIAAFRLSPSLVIALTAFTPVPFAAVRALSALSGHSFPAYLAAMTVGRFPRLWLVALVGTAIPLSAGQILVVGGSVALLAALAIGLRRAGTGTPADQPGGGPQSGGSAGPPDPLHPSYDSLRRSARPR